MRRHRRCVVRPSSAGSDSVGAPGARVRPLRLSRRRIADGVCLAHGDDGRLPLVATLGFRAAPRRVSGARRPGRAHGRTRTRGGEKHTNPRPVILALADISHIVSLDAASGRGLESQADIAPQEPGERRRVRHEAWRWSGHAARSPPRSPRLLAGSRTSYATRGGTAAAGPRGRITLDGPIAVPVCVLAGVHGEACVRRARGRVAATAPTSTRASSKESSARPDAGGVRRLAVPVSCCSSGRCCSHGWCGVCRRPGAAGVPSSAHLGEISLPRFAFAAVPWSPSSPSFAGAMSRPRRVVRSCRRLGIAAYRRAIQPVGRHRQPESGRVEYVVRRICRDVRSCRHDRARSASRTLSATRGAVVESYAAARGRHTSRRTRRRDASLCASTARGSTSSRGGRFATPRTATVFERYIRTTVSGSRASVDPLVSPDETLAPPALQDVQVKRGRTHWSTRAGIRADARSLRRRRGGRDAPSSLAVCARSSRSLVAFLGLVDRRAATRSDHERDRRDRRDTHEGLLAVRCSARAPGSIPEVTSSSGGSRAMFNLSRSRPARRHSSSRSKRTGGEHGVARRTIRP